MKLYMPFFLLLALCGCETSEVTSLDSESESVATGVIAEKTMNADVSEPVKGRVSQPGLYRLVRSGGVIDDPSTSTGKSVSKPVVELVKTTDRIPLIKGVQMYLQYRIWPLPAQPAYADIRRVLKHPAMKLPDGSVSTGSDYTIKSRVSSKQVIGYTGYGFDEVYELVEGDWIFEVWYAGEKVIEERFVTYKPDETEVTKLKPLLALGNKAVGQQQTDDKAVSRFDWPRITVGGARSAETTDDLDAPSDVAD
jgi:hypothetical protein